MQAWFPPRVSAHLRLMVSAYAPHNQLPVGSEAEQQVPQDQQLDDVLAVAPVHSRPGQQQYGNEHANK